jgi:ABC-type multidrug transport system fused ATPase/permease subunit
VAIARAVLRDAPIVLLDEATSSLDSETEAAIQAATNELLTGKTSIIIAHRLATVLSADRIHVISNGLLTEAGTHHELLSHDGLYARLYGIQFKQ